MTDYSKSKKISNIKNLIENGAIEKEIQIAFDDDLSLIAEVYSNPKDEYICFSQFPIRKCTVDFAVFTNRSRMEIVLIEIKGANFNFSNSSSYKNISRKINEAAQQLRHKITLINDNYREFRACFHKVRREVEIGTNHHNSLLGPNGYLHVDSEKDICIRGVIIGGRCRDNLYESKLRHQFETMTIPNIKVESWDSWLRKIPNYK